MKIISSKNKLLIGAGISILSINHNIKSNPIAKAFGIITKGNGITLKNMFLSPEKTPNSFYYALQLEKSLQKINTKSFLKQYYNNLDSLNKEFPPKESTKPQLFIEAAKVYCNSYLVGPHSPLGQLYKFAAKNIELHSNKSNQIATNKSTKMEDSMKMEDNIKNFIITLIEDKYNSFSESGKKDIFFQLVHDLEKVDSSNENYQPDLATIFVYDAIIKATSIEKTETQNLLEEKK